VGTSATRSRHRLSGDATRWMATVTVRVAPRSGRTAIEIGPDGIVLRVRSAAEGG
jgi:hypothetical protein